MNPTRSRLIISLRTINYFLLTLLAVISSASLVIGVAQLMPIAQAAKAFNSCIELMLERDIGGRDKSEAYPIERHFAYRRCIGALDWN